MNITTQHSNHAKTMDEQTYQRMVTLRDALDVAIKAEHEARWDLRVERDRLGQGQ